MDAEAPMEYMTTEEYEARNKAMEGLMMLRQHWPALAQLQAQDPPRNHVCRTCHMAFTRLDNLQRHIRRLHEADADTLYYSCRICPQNGRSVVTDRRDNMKRHVVQKHKNMTVCTCRYFGPAEVCMANHLKKCEAPIETRTAAEWMVISNGQPLDLSLDI